MRGGSGSAAEGSDCATGVGAGARLHLYEPHGECFVLVHAQIVDEVRFGFDLIEGQAELVCREAANVFHDSVLKDELVAGCIGKLHRHCQSNEIGERYTIGREVRGEAGVDAREEPRACEKCADG